MLRKSTLVAMGILLGCTSVLLGIPTAAAASYDGDLRIKGPGGTPYTDGPHVSQVGAEGATLTYTIQVLNTGSSIAQFKIEVFDATAATLELYEGSLRLTPLASGPDGYYTKALQPGGNQVLTAKLTIPTHPTEYRYGSAVVLSATDGTPLDHVIPLGEQVAPPATIGYDMAVKAGSQKLVGNRQTGQIATAGTISSTGSTTFTVILKNASTFTSSIFFRLRPPTDGDFGEVCPNFKATVKQGTTNVTDAALAGTYQTPLLQPGGSRTLKVTIKATGTACTSGDWSASAGNFQGSTLRHSRLMVNLRA